MLLSRFHEGRSSLILILKCRFRHTFNERYDTEARFNFSLSAPDLMDIGNQIHRIPLVLKMKISVLFRSLTSCF